MNQLRSPVKRLLAYALCSLLASPAAPAYAGLTDISDGPVANPASAVHPNLLVILDDSSSMGRQFTPDYVSTYHIPGSSVITKNCLNALDTSLTVTSTPDECWAGDPPAMAPDFNTQYYNPEVRYMPAVDYNGTERASMTCANTGGVVVAGLCTGGWTAVPTDNVSASTTNVSRKGLHLGSSLNSPNGDWGMSGPAATLSTMNLVTGFPDRAWCDSQTATVTDTLHCRLNSSYTYPDGTFGYGADAAGNRRYTFGAPYYYRIVPTKYCTDQRLTTCVASTVPTVVGGVSYATPAPVRFCTLQLRDPAVAGSVDTLTNCAAIRIPGTRDVPEFVGVIPSGLVSAATFASGLITVKNPQSDTLQGNVGSILVSNGVTSVDVTGAFTLSAGQTASQWATFIRDKINARTATSGYRATVATNVVTVISTVAGPDYNGNTITVNYSVSGTTPATITITFTGTVRSSTAGASGQLSSLIIDGREFVSSIINCTATACNSSTAANRDAAMALQVRTLLVPPAGWTVGGTGNTVVITAPTTTGAEMNGKVLTFTAARTTPSGSNTNKLAGATTAGDVEYTSQNFTGGAPATSRTGVGTFVRVNLVPGNIFTRYSGRTDCAGAQCTYEEEMTNFANWFAYYRTRIQMARTAIGRAFVGLTNNFRVGFMTINFASTKYLAVNDFTAGAGNQKNNFFTQLYAVGVSGSTPLRTALSRAGRYFGNQNPNSMGATPINSACQANYSILTSDGYWNDSGTGAAVKLNGTTQVGDQDGDGTSNTLADVAYYYYNTDLSTLTDQVPASGRDTAVHQHMTTFTVGMGVAGTLLYSPNYLEKGSSLDYDALTASPPTMTWPVPTADAATTVDDMWHAAENGHGQFFSARDPSMLAVSLAEVLTSVAKRIGAGAAAATSNLQPVAGDNFAFTAEYQTLDWTGDVKARTINLVDGTIATRQLWSASAMLDQRSNLDRHIYTFDAADIDATATITVAGTTRTQNGNRLRSFCRTNAALGTNPTCDDGGLLTQTELDNYFDPLGGLNGAVIQTTTWPAGDPRLTAATPGSLVRYLSGQTSNEMALGGTGPSDLYRNRPHLLGDVINAQPAYVKGSPFSYSAATDPFYTDFKNSTNGTVATRRGTVYVAANDGMLHAFETDPDNIPYFQTAGINTPDTRDDTFTGTLSTDPISGEGAERWAYVPTLVFPGMKRLAEDSYSTNHKFLTDGSPTIGDVCFGHSNSTPCASMGRWHTILVAGLNAGGRGYYALDITDPMNPKGLWEVAGGAGATCLTHAQANAGTATGDCNIGYTFGNPVIVKRPADGKWVVLLTSGYNNVNPGSGLGYLYVLDAETGRILNRMTTNVGCSVIDNPDGACLANVDDPSGLARINAWADNGLLDNTALTVYGGDVKGNLWRFQLEATAAVPAYSVTRVATLMAPDGTAQPITTRPELAEISGNRVIYVGTGKFLGLSDKTDLQRQSIYAIKDTMANTTSPVHDMTRTSSTTIAGFVSQTLANGTTVTGTRTVATPNTVDFGTDNGWFVDLPDGGTGEDSAERVNVDPILQLGTLIMPSNVPSTQTCTAGGYGWVNFFDYKTGGDAAGGTIVSTKVAGSLIVGINAVQIGNTVKTIVTTADNSQISTDTPITASSFSGRRVSWRELFVE